MKLVRASRRLSAAFTLAELLVATGIFTMSMAAVFAFLNGTGRAISGVVTQSVLNERAGYALEYMQSRIRTCTWMTNDTTGNSLILAFDDNYKVDSGGDKIPYNDRDHYEMFKFVGVNTTNELNATTNQILYYANTNSNASKTLISAGVRNLPGYKIFTITNSVIAVIRYGLGDSYTNDYFQAVDIQATGVSLNRQVITNTISILP